MLTGQAHGRNACCRSGVHRSEPRAPTIQYEPQGSNTIQSRYRHLAYIQTLIGYTVKLDMPQLTGPEVDRLYARGKAWLSGGPLAA